MAEIDELRAKLAALREAEERLGQELTLTAAQRRDGNRCEHCGSKYHHTPQHEPAVQEFLSAVARARSAISASAPPAPEPQRRCGAFARALAKSSSNERKPTARVDLEARVKHGVLGTGLVPHDGGAAALLAAVTPMPPVVCFIAPPYPASFTREDVWLDVRSDIHGPPGWRLVRDDASVEMAIVRMYKSGCTLFTAREPGMVKRMPHGPARYVFALRGVQERAPDDLVPGADGVLEPRGRTRKKSRR